MDKERREARGWKCLTRLSGCDLAESLQEVAGQVERVNYRCAREGIGESLEGLCRRKGIKCRMHRELLPIIRVAVKPCQKVETRGAQAGANSPIKCGSLTSPHPSSSL